MSQLKKPAISVGQYASKLILDLLPESNYCSFGSGPMILQRQETEMAANLASLQKAWAEDERLSPILGEC